MKEKRGQVWIETVLYTLIGLALIGLVLTFALPKITDAKDSATVKQAIESLNDLDNKINAVTPVAGNRGIFEITINRGNLNFDLANDKIIFLIEGLRKPYSEPGVDINYGRVVIKTTEGQKESSVALTLNYNLDLIFGENEDDSEKKFNPSSVPYRFSITNAGNGKIKIIELSQ